MTGLVLGSQSIVILRPDTVTDAYGNTVFDWGNAMSTTVGGCSVQPLVGEEQLPQGRDAVETSWRLFAPAGVDLLAADRVQFEGVTYEISGEVRRWPAPWGGQDHVEAQLRVVRG